MSNSPVTGAGTLLRVEEVRQRLNQCGLQGEKVTRKTARKYVPPTATSSRTVADMARRLGSVEPEGKELHVKGGKQGQGEERLVTGEIYRSFSIHTRNIHKRFNRQASPSTKGEEAETTPSLSTETSSATSPTSENSCNNSQIASREPKLGKSFPRARELSPISLKIASAPPAMKQHCSTTDATDFSKISHIVPVKSAPLSNSNESNVPQTQKSPTQKAKSPPVAKKPINNEKCHFKNLTSHTSQTSSGKQSESIEKDTSSSQKQNEENKGFGLKNMNFFSKFKISPFSNKKSPTENKIVAAKNSATLKEVEESQSLKDNVSSKLCPDKTKNVQDTLQPKSHLNGVICDTKTTRHHTAHDKKITHAKHALSGERVNIQELMNNSPKVPKKEPSSPKKEPTSPKKEPSSPKKEPTSPKKEPTSPKTKAPSPKHTTVRKGKSLADNTPNSNQSLKNSGANGIISKPNIPHPHNNQNNTTANGYSFIDAKDNFTTIDKTDSHICNDSVNKANYGDGITVVEGEDNPKIIPESTEGTSKQNGTAEPMDISRVVFYKAKCLLQDPGKMGSKEKVKVDESEPSFYEEAPFERRDVTVKSDRWVTDLYTVESLLGKGKFGEVKKCQERKTGRQLAAKFIEVNGPQDRNDVLNELEIMKNLQHPRLLQLYDAFEIRDKFCLVMELVNGGELFERVINDDFILTEKACVMFTRQICDGIAFMHTQNILHLDMKPENILCLTREGNRIKIIDFGLARKYNPKDDLRVLFGTPEFVAPEVVNFDPIQPATDMWSIGVVCYVLLSGLSPFMGESEQETLANVTLAQWDFSAEEFDNISSEAKDFISKLLVKDPRKRMKSAECLEHQWLRRSVKREGHLPERSLSKKRLRKFVYRRKWQKAINAMLALRRMGVTLS